MMERDAWDEVVGWVADRFPHDLWHPEQAIAYFDDLVDMTSDEVWAGLHAIYEAGTGYAPNGSQMLAAAKVIRHADARADRYRSLPEKRGDPVDFDRWSTRRFGETLSGTALIERIHRDAKPCNNRGCDIHYPPTKEGTT